MSDFPPDTVGARLSLLLRFSGVSTRGIDRLARRREGHFALILHRLRANPEAEIELGTAVDYCQVFGVNPTWLRLGIGDEPTETSVRAAVAATQPKPQAA